MNRILVLSICVVAATLIIPPHAVDARGKKVRRQRARSGKVLRPTKIKLKKSRARFTWRRLTVRSRARQGVSTRKRAKVAKRRFSLLKARRTRCGVTTSKTSARKATARAGKGVRFVARVRPMSRRTFKARSSRVLVRLRGSERQQAVGLLASRRVRSSTSARHTVLAYLRLRSVKGGSKLPISITDIKGMVGSKRWTSQRLANLALVLQQARQIARTKKVSPKEAFNRALRQNGIYRKYNSGVCGA
jgi:hypothetical protein